MLIGVEIGPGEFRERNALTNYAIWHIIPYKMASFSRIDVIMKRNIDNANDSSTLLADSLTTVIEAIKEGLPVSTFENLSEKMGVTESRLAEVTGIALRTLNRRKREGKFKPDESERVYRIYNLFELALRVMGSEDSARQWFISPKKAFGGQSPFFWADTEPGAREVEDMLGRLAHGVFL